MLHICALIYDHTELEINGITQINLEAMRVSSKHLQHIHLFSLGLIRFFFPF